MTTTADRSMPVVFSGWSDDNVIIELDGDSDEELVYGPTNFLVSAPTGEQLIVRAEMKTSWRFTVHPAADSGAVPNWKVTAARPEHPEYEDEDDETLMILAPVGTTVARV